MGLGEEWEEKGKSLGQTGKFEPDQEDLKSVGESWERFWHGPKSQLGTLSNSPFWII